MDGYTFADAARDFSQICERWMAAHRINVLRIHLKKYADHLESVAEADAEKVVRIMRSKFSRWEEEFAELELWPEVREQFKVETLQNHEALAKAAALVFWHATVDAMAFDLCVLIGKLHPTKWEAALAEKRIQFSEVQKDDPEAIRLRLLKKHCKELDKQSLNVKLEQLFQMCEADTSWSWSSLYKFDSDKLKKIDGLRHQMIHGNGLQSAHQLSDDDLDYLSTTGLYLVNLVGYKFDLKVFGNDVKTATPAAS